MNIEKFFNNTNSNSSSIFIIINSEELQLYQLF